MTPEQKLQAVLKLYYSAQEMKAGALKMQHPDWSENEIKQKIKAFFLYART